MSSKLLCHIQIAKAATNSIRQIVQDNVPPDRFSILKIRGRQAEGRALTTHSDLPEIKTFVEHVATSGEKLEAVSMMLSVGLHQHIEREVEYFSVVREPVGRCLSALNFVYTRRDSHPFADNFAAHGYRPHRLIEDGELLFTNDQVRMLIGSERPEVTLEDFDEAREVIEERFSFVGVAEHSKPSWARLAALYGWKADPARILNKGVYSGDLGLNESDKRYLREANEFDSRLYDWVLKDYLPRRHAISIL